MNGSPKELRLPLNLMLRWKRFVLAKPPPNAPSPLGLTQDSSGRLRLADPRPKTWGDRERSVEGFIRNHS